MPQFQTKMFCPHIYFCHHFLAEFLDNCCYPAGGGLLCQRSDTRRGDGSDEGNAGPLTYDYTSISRLLGIWSGGIVHGTWLVLLKVSCASLQACKRGNADIVRLLLEYGADCNILSKHKNTAMYFAKLSNNLMVCDLIKDHISMWVLTTVSSVTSLSFSTDAHRAAINRRCIWSHSSFKTDYWPVVCCAIRSCQALHLVFSCILLKVVPSCFFLPISPSPRLCSVAEDTIRAYFESRLVLLEPVFPLACHRLCEGPDFSLEFGFKSQPQPEGKTHNYSISRSSAGAEIKQLQATSHLSHRASEFLFCHWTEPFQVLNQGLRPHDSFSPLKISTSLSRLGHPPLHLPC